MTLSRREVLTGGLFRSRRTQAPSPAGPPLLVQQVAPEGRAAVRAKALADRRVGQPPSLPVLQPFSCLSLRGVGCTVCVEQCPVAGALGWEGLRPTIDAEACTGCGECVDACPAPGKALLLLPRREAM